jgi:aminopeptidase
MNLQTPIAAAPIDETKLDRLAEVAVKVGLRLQPGQDLLLTAPVEALPLVRRIAEHAYKAGAGIVTPFLSDPEITLARFRHADESFDRAPAWLYDGMGKAFDENTARLAIVGDDPMLLADEDPEKVGRANKANSIAYTPARERITGFDINWNIVAWPGTAWARRVFPDLPMDEAVARLADAIFAASRVDADDAVAALGGAQCRAEAALRLAQRPELPRPAFHRAGHRPDRGAGRWA